MSFVVIRHPDAGLGTCPVEALDTYRINGWARVSEDERAEPGDFNLADFADASDVDAVEETPAPAELAAPAPTPAKATKESKA
jgi:hypothetical protein